MMDYDRLASQLLDDSNIKQLAEEIAEDPEFNKMVEQLPKTYQGDPDAVFTTMDRIMKDPGFIYSALMLGPKLMQVPSVPTILRKMVDPSQRAQLRERRDFGIEDPLLKSILQEIRLRGPGAVLRLVDSDERPAMGFIYEAMDRAKEQIQKNFNNILKSYEHIWEIIDKRWESQLHHPLHAAGYYLNPQYHYSPSFHSDAEVKIGLYDCLARMVPRVEDRVKIDLQMDAFTNARGLFGLDNAVMTRTKKSPADWWKSYGDQCPELQEFAIRILSLTCSSSGCERNWSAFEMVHSKRRNRLHQQRLNDLVFVMYNLKLRERNMNRQAITDPICLDDIPSDDEWITEREDPTLPTNGNWLGVLERGAQRDIDEEDEVEVIARTLGRASGESSNVTPREVEEIHEISEEDEDENLNTSIDVDDLNDNFGEAIGANNDEDEDEDEDEGDNDSDDGDGDGNLDENFGNDDDLI